MKHLFVPYEIASKLKEKGFNEPCYGIYAETGYQIFESITIDMPSTDGVRDAVSNNNLITSNSCAAPMHQQVIDWFRTQHGIRITDSIPRDCWNSNGHSEFRFNVIKVDGLKTTDMLWRVGLEGKTFNLYYEALNFAIEESLKIISKND